MERYTMRLPDDLGAVPVDGYGTPEIIDRLAAYEDTGLEPKQIKSIAESGAKFCEAYEAVDAEIGFAHLKELMDAEAEGRLLVLETAPRDSYKGLKRKYIVLKSDSGEPVENCFVLRPDKDTAAKIALEAYAKTTGNKTLADDITRWIGDSGKALVLPCAPGAEVWVVERDEDGCAVDVSGYMFLAKAGDAVILTAYVNNLENVQDTLAYHMQETAENYDTDLAVFPADDCYTTLEEAEAALGKERDV